METRQLAATSGDTVAAPSKACSQNLITSRGWDSTLFGLLPLSKVCLLTCVVLDEVNRNKDHDGAYHGYAAKNLYAINPNYGTADDLKSLINAAHNKVTAVQLHP